MLPYLLGTNNIIITNYPSCRLDYWLKSLAKIVWNQTIKIKKKTKILSYLNFNLPTFLGIYKFAVTYKVIMTLETIINIIKKETKMHCVKGYTANNRDNK